MPSFPAFKTKPYYDALKTWLTTSLNEDGTLRSDAVQAEVSAAIAAEPTVVQAAADAVDANPTIAELQAVTPDTTGQPGQATIYGPTSPTFADMETVIFDHVFERSATPATNRANLQTLLDRVAPGGSGEQVRVFIPPKFSAGVPDPMVLDRDGANAWCVDVPSGVSIEGAGPGSTIKLADAQPNFTRIVNINTQSDVAIRRLRLDGNRANNDLTYEHNHNIMIWDSTDVVIEDVETVDATGDGVFIGGSVPTISERVWLYRVTSTGHKRNPVTASEVSDVWIDHCYLIAAADSGGQAVDSEPDVDVDLWGLSVTNSILGHESSGDVYAVSLSGRPGFYRRNTRIIGNEFRGGGIYAANSKDALVSGNTGRLSQVVGSYGSTGLHLTGNTFDFDTESDYAIDLARVGTAYPENVLIDGNTLRMTSSSAYGSVIGVRSAQNVLVANNLIDGLEIHNGVFIQPTAGNNANIAVRGNTFTNGRYGVEVYTHATHLTTGLAITDNLFSDTPYYAIRLWSGGANYQNVAISGNTTIEQVASQIIDAVDVPYLMGGTQGGGGIYSVWGTPEGVITERVGAVAYRRDGGAGTTMYVKESGTGNTGWIAK